MLSNAPQAERQAIGRSFQALLQFNRATLAISPHPLKVGSCVQDCMALQAVLKRVFDIDSELLCADFCAWNANMRIGVMDRHAGRDPQFDPARAPAYAVEVAHGMENPTDRYSGHALLRTVNHTIDPTIGQAWRQNGRQVLLDPPPMLFLDNELFGPLDMDEHAWLTWPRPSFLHTNRPAGDQGHGVESAPGMGMADLGPLLRNHAAHPGPMAVLRAGQDCWVAYLTRADLKVEVTYARWQDPGFRSFTEEMVDRLCGLLMLPLHHA